MLQPPSWSHILGTTENGSDVFSQLLVGTRVSVIVGFAAALISAVLGSLVGLTGGYFGGWTDRILDAFENWFLVIPTLPLMIVLARLLNPSLIVLIAVIGLTSWAGTGRIVRAQVLTLRERAFVERARALGAERQLHHQDPHPPQHAAADLRQHGPDRRRGDPLRGGARRSSASATRPRSRGERCSRTRFSSGAPSAGAWWYVVPPGLCITLLVLAVSLLGYLFEEYINPRLRERDVSAPARGRGPARHPRRQADRRRRRPDARARRGARARRRVGLRQDDDRAGADEAAAAGARAERHDHAAPAGRRGADQHRPAHRDAACSSSAGATSRSSSRGR